VCYCCLYYWYLFWYNNKYYRWIQGCHKYFDQELKLEDRFFELEEYIRGVNSNSPELEHALNPILKYLPKSYSNKDVSVFKSLLVVNGSSTTKIAQNKLVKLSRFKTNSKKRCLDFNEITVKKEIIGRIIGFEVEQLPSQQVFMLLLLILLLLLLLSIFV